MAAIREKIRGGDSRGPVALVLYLMPWAFVVLSGIKLKHRLLTTEGGGFDFLMEVVGSGLAWWQRLALFREDILVVLIIGSIAFIGLLKATSPRWRAPVAWVICTSLFLILFAELKSWWEVGTFISAKLMADGLFGSGRDFVIEYATSNSVRRLYASLLGITAACIGLGLLERRATSLRRLQWTYWPLTACAAVVVMTSWLVKVPETPFDRAATTAALAAFAGRSEFQREPPDFSHLPARGLIAQYAALANAPVPNKPSPWFGSARGSDVVFILLESLPDACYDMAKAEGAMPNVSALEAQAFVADAHYATYPYSRRAYSSIFSSWYPANGVRGAFERYSKISGQLRAPGVIHSGAVSGYRTVAFVPERPVALENDELRYAALGFEEHEVPPSAYERPEGFLLDNSHRSWVRTRDRESFKELKNRVARSIDAHERFLYSFNPQLTHGPWPGVTDSSTRDETCRSGFGLFSEVDSMVGELRSLLRDKGRLEKTIIVVLGDHGLRTRREYPPFHGGTLEDITFHVPLILSAPGVLDSTQHIPWMTSHIDIAPSVLDLLGISTDRNLELGSPIWEPALAARTTFFFAKGYLGADGFQRSNEAVMVRYLYGGVLKARWNGALHFRAGDLQPPQSRAAAQGTLDDVTMMAAIQSELQRTMLPSIGTLAKPRLDRRASAREVRVAQGGSSAVPP